MGFQSLNKWVLSSLFFYNSVQFCPKSFAQENTKVLPQGISDIRVISIVGTEVSETYTPKGLRTPLMSPLNFVISPKQIASSQNDFKLLYESLNRFQRGLGDALFQTEVRGKGSLNFQRWYGLYERSLTSRWSVGFMFPIIGYESHLSVDVSHNTSNLESVKSRVQNTPLEKGIETFEGRLPTSTQILSTLFTDRGYVLPTSKKITGFGDLEIGTKYQYAKFEDIICSFLLGLRLPTASHIADPGNLLDRSTGDGQFDTVSQFVTSFAANAHLTFATSLKLTVQFPDTNRMPVPLSGDPRLPNLKDPRCWDDVRRDLGDIFESEISSSYKFWGDQLSSYLAYQYALQSKDLFKGNKSYLDYAALSKNTPNQAHRLEVGFGFSTVPAVINKKFSLPIDIRIAYNSMLRGKNSPNIAYTRLDMVLYF